MSRRHRFLSAAFTLVALLFAQLAVAAYACPMLPERAVAPMQAPCDMQDMEPVKDASLCASHCQDTVASLDWAKGALAAQAIESGMRVVAALPPAPFIRTRAAAIRAVDAPPLPERFTVLRI